MGLGSLFCSILEAACRQHPGAIVDSVPFFLFSQNNSLALLVAQFLKMVILCVYLVF